jgi:cellulose synthase/poly-beta-1,6-N-acetylglucosamine synthase-like glycosyltransferase
MGSAVAILQAMFWTCATLCLHHHFFYPISIRLAAGLRRHVSARPDTSQTTADLVPMTLIIPAHNEAAHVERKIRNIKEIDYPSEHLRIVLALDGCADETKECAIAAAQQYLSRHDAEILEYQCNVGKLAVLNAQIARSTTPIVAVSDTSALIAPDAMTRAAKHFQNPGTGFVAATYRLLDALSPGEKAYNDYLVRIRRDEAALDSPLGVHGSLYFFRKDLWEPLPADTINDDFVLPMRIVARGYRGIYDPQIVSFEMERPTILQEFRRRVRIGAGNLQQTARLWRLSDPRRPWIAFMFTSGKGLRPLMPFIAIVGLLAGLGLAVAGHELYGWVIGLGLATSFISKATSHWIPYYQPRLLAWIGYLVDGYCASLLGSLKYLVGRRISYWQRSSKHGALPPFDICWKSAAALPTAAGRAS